MVERLEKLEARVASLPDREAERERKRLYELHFVTWATRGSFADIPEKQRDPEMWESVVEYAPIFLGYIWEGFHPGREEFLAAGVDFTLADDVSDVIGGRKYGAPGPDTPRKL
jgi:hypothetical protein